MRIVILEGSEKHKTHRLLIISFILLIISLFIPWWFVNIDSSSDSGFWHPDPSLEIFAPAWSPFIFSTLGTKLSLHFQNLLILLVASLLFLGFSWFLVKRRLFLSTSFTWASASFCGIGILLFSMLFPRIGYAGYIFWPWGSGEFATYSYNISLSWLVFPGFFLAIGSFILQIYIAVFHSRTILKEKMPAPTESFKVQPRASSRSVKAQLVAVLISWITIAAAIWGGLSYSPTISVKALLNDINDDGNHKSFEHGDRVFVSGKVTNVALIPTSYGEYTLLDLDSHGFYYIALKGNWKNHYPLGSWASIPLHFGTYSYNGFDFTWADEAFAPVSFLYMMSELFARLSHIMGATILPYDTSTDMSRFKIYMPHGFPLDTFNASLVKVEGPPYIAESGYVGSWSPEGIVDQMIPLRLGTSDNASFNFADVNGNNLLDWGDVFDVNLPSTAEAIQFESYILRIYGPKDIFAYIAVGNQGPFLFYLQDSEEADPFFFFTMPPDIINGDLCESRVDILNKIGPDFSNNDFNVGIIEEYLMLGDQFPADTVETIIDGGAVVRFQDGGKTGILDGGDAWILENLKNGTHYALHLFNGNTGNSISSIRWVCGVGTNIAYPRVNLSSPIADPTDPQRFIINVTSVEWAPAVEISWYRVLLLKNDTIILPPGTDPSSKYLDALPIGPSSDGANTWLDFIDSDENGYFGAGDYFTVNNTASQSNYELMLYCYPRWITSVTWTT